MKVRIDSRLTFLAAALASTQLASGAIIFTDTFDSGTGGWYKANTSTNVLSNDSGQLSFNAGNATNSADVIGRSFTETTLAVGETMRLSFDVGLSGAVGILRFGLFDSTGSAISADGWAVGGAGTGDYAGYYTFIRDASDLGNVARVESGSFGSGSTGTYPASSGTTITIGTDTTNYDLDGNYTVTFDITRQSLTQTDTLLTVLEGATTRFSVGGSQTSDTPFSTFDTAVLRFDAGTALIDNVSVTLISESSAVLPLLSAFTYNPADGSSQASIKGAPGGRYKLLEASDLDFSTPDQDPVPLTAASVGTLDGDVVVLDAGGNATIQFNLGNTKAATFIRAEESP